VDVAGEEVMLLERKWQSSPARPDVLPVASGDDEGVMTGGDVER
jgi:hypothetical protein